MVDTGNGDFNKRNKEVRNAAKNPHISQSDFKKLEIFIRNSLTLFLGL